MRAWGSIPIMTISDFDSNPWACLDWPLVLEALQKRAQTGYGQERIQTQTLWHETEPEVTRALALVSELRTLIQRYGDETLQGLPECRPTLKRLSKDGRLYSVSELAELTTVLSEMSRLFRFVIQHRSAQETPEWVRLLEAVTLPNVVLDGLTEVIAPQLEATLKETASPAYRDLFYRVTQQRQNIERRLQGLLGKWGAVLQESLVTQRDGRYVLPVRAGAQSQVDGTVVDSSLSGDTVFIEPKTISADCATLRRLQKELDAEVELILDRLSALIRPHCDALLVFVEQFGQLDELWAKAVLSIDLDASALSVAKEPGIVQLKRARHPLLVLQNKDSVVANDVVFSNACRCVIVSGPNTGGKTVTLKLLGLFALMLRCGMHVPVAENADSQMSLFSPIFADSGDSQSVVQNLSTFSAHLRRLKAILEAADLSHGLILIDEIGAGTDPAEATALAESVLKHLVYERHATVMVTTHLSSLKRLAYEESGFENASVDLIPRR
jgi:DNA mismatch repair protein MutS2